ncbi:DNA-binding response regulator [Actinophytocola xinjiangensis]|uniref:DNA-binding response regulator n=1 Tax=Actinophytocola xinjiangensis TaxID=485602 RepID=A0A7Z0WNR8_9PSEU|nr:response regulator transcription factor [Actinophytocola xinjiangensis]OLF11185.1 DNA-binding response regulator [Actinophytocola xinjiangensis]
MRVLVVEDDVNVRDGVVAVLRAAGFAVDTAPDLPAADEALWINRYDCVVFDRMLPAGDSLHYVAHQRAKGWPVPVLFLTARDSEADRLAGLRQGGDDYLVKPFAAAELVARVRSLCRRVPTGRAPVLRCADVELDVDGNRVTRAGVLLTLTRKELLVLQRLMSTAGRPVSRRELIAHAWDRNAELESNALDQTVRGLRRKLREPPLIHTVRGVGYLITR